MEIDDANVDSHQFKHEEKKNETLCTTPKGEKNKSKVEVEDVKSDPGTLCSSCSRENTSSLLISMSRSEQLAWLSLVIGDSLFV
jgi:hypothetical protein